MTSSNRFNLPLALAAVAMAALILTASSAHAQLESELGILDLNANGGINPATGAAWAHGDTYRLIFNSSTTTDATSSDISVYNTHVQNAANASSLNLSSVNWNAVVSTPNIDARDNTSTNPNTDGTGESIWLMNGTENIWTDYAHLWAGNLVQGSDDIDRDEENNAVVTYAGGWGPWGPVWTGTTGDGTAQNPVGTGNNVNLGLAFGDGAAHWIARSNGSEDDLLYVYGLSDPLTVVDPSQLVVPEPASIAIWTMIGLGLAGFGYYRIRRKK